MVVRTGNMENKSERRLGKKFQILRDSGTIFDSDNKLKLHIISS